MSGMQASKALLPGLIVALLLVGCAPVLPPVEETPVVGPPAGFPEQYYREAAAEGAEVYRINPERSLMVVDVLPEGPLAPTLGHSHTVSTHRVQGYVRKGDEAGSGRADLFLSVYDLEVDNPDVREAAGFTSELSPEDIRGTRRNMLTPVLEAERYPWVRVRAEPLAGGGDTMRLGVDLTLHGQTRRLIVPVTIEDSAELLKVQGAFSLRQSEFGIEPFSALGGNLRVRDKLDVRFELVAGEFEG